EVLDEDKVKALEELLKKYDIDQVLIFRHTKRGVDKLVESLQRRGHKVEALHGDLSQRERERTLDAFRDGSLPMLVATNVAARGLQIEAGLAQTAAPAAQTSGKRPATASQKWSHSNRPNTARSRRSWRG